MSAVNTEMARNQFTKCTNLNQHASVRMFFCRFMAPEVYKREPYGLTVDVYSYAMIFFYLLDGKPPWPYLNGVVAVKKAAEEGDRPPIPRSWDSRLQVIFTSSRSDGSMRYAVQFSSD